MSVRLRRTLVAALAATLAAGFALAAPAGAHHGSDPTIDVQLLAINDLHGNLDPPAGSSGTITTLVNGQRVQVPAGGVEYLSTHLNNARAGHRNSLTLAAGDNIGASPLLSAAFHDEPTILALNKLGLSLSSVGNHEFDEGLAELRRIRDGGCRTDDGCYDPANPYQGTDFPYLGANVVDEKTGRPVLQPFTIRYMHGALVAFIGVVTKNTPNVVTADGIKGLKFLDEADTVNQYTHLLQRFGIHAIAMVAHEGDNAATPVYNFDCDSPTPGAGLTGPIQDIAKRLDPDVDLLFTAHSHQSYVCNIPDSKGRKRLVTQAASFGRLFTEVNFKYDRRSHDIIRDSETAVNHIVTRDVPKDPAMTDLITKYKTLIAPIANKTVGYISADINGRGAPTPETPLGDLLADAQLEATKAPDKGGAQIAFMNPGGIRSDLVFKASGAEGDGVVTYGEAFTVQPFNNNMVTVTLTGAQVVKLLQQQYSEANAADPKVLQVSSGLTYTVDLKRADAARVLVDTIKLNGTPIDQAANYRVAVNSFLAGGGDGFTVLRAGTSPLVGGLDIDAFTAYLTGHSSAQAPLAPPAANRITFTT